MKTSYQQLPVLCINVPLLIAWENFTLLTLLTAWKRKHLPPVKAEVFLASFSPLWGFPEDLCLIGLLFWLHSQITHFPSFNCFKTRLVGSDCTKLSFTNNGFSPLCYGFHRVPLNLTSFFCNIIPPSTMSSRQTTYW